MQTKNDSTTTTTLSGKLALAAGGGAAAVLAGGMPSAADATVVFCANVPISPPSTTGSNPWDVDGDGTNDFVLENKSSFGSDLANFIDANGGRLVVPAAATSGGISKLSLGVAIGTSLAGSYKFNLLGQSYNSITYGGNIGVASTGGWSVGDTGFFGFRFTAGAATHYGWGEMEITGTGDGAGFDVLRAYYNDEAGAPVSAGVVPEPSSVSLLALGAAGLAAWRRRR